MPEPDPGTVDNSTAAVVARFVDATPSDSDGRMHPNRLLAALQRHLASDAVLVADGGDFLSFARFGLSAATYMDPGSLGCIGIGTALGVAASLALTTRQVVVATGDGAFGFNRLQFADHAAMAGAFGMCGQHEERIEDLDLAISTAMQHLPALLDVVVSTQARSSDSNSGLARVPDPQAVDAWDNAERHWLA